MTAVLYDCPMFEIHNITQIRKSNGQKKKKKPKQKEHKNTNHPKLLLSCKARKWSAGLATSLCSRKILFISWNGLKTQNIFSYFTASISSWLEVQHNIWYTMNTDKHSKLRNTRCYRASQNLAAHESVCQILISWWNTQSENDLLQRGTQCQQKQTCFKFPALL